MLPSLNTENIVTLGSAPIQPSPAQPASQVRPNSSNFIEQTPVVYPERLPDLSGVLDGVANEPALLAQLEVDVVLVVLTLDVRHVDGDEDVRRLLLQPQQRQDDGREVWCVTGGFGGVVWLGCLRRDEGVGGNLGAGGPGIVSER